MKNVWFSLTILLTFLLVVQYRLTKHTKEQRMKLAESSFEHGCLVQSQSACNRLHNVFERSDCLEDAFVNCTKWGVGFRMWLERGPTK